MYRIEFNAADADYAILDDTGTLFAYAATYEAAVQKRDDANDRRLRHLASTPPDPMTRLDALTPRIHAAIQSTLCYMQPADIEDAISEAQVKLLELIAADDTFIHNTDSYIVQRAVYAARDYARTHLTYERRCRLTHQHTDLDAPYIIAMLRHSTHDTRRWTRLPEHTMNALDFRNDDEPARLSTSRELIAFVLERLTGTTRIIALGIMRGLSKREACAAAGVSRQSYPYYRRKLAVALADFAD
jgi:hypothetical protein